MNHNIPSSSQGVVARGVLWTYAAYYGGKILIFLSTIVLARLLTQEDFGIAAYALVFISLLDSMNDLGVGAALIYHQKDPNAVNTAFWLGIGISLTLFLIAFLCAPLVGAFFNDARAIPVTRALALTFPISALGNIHDVLLRKDMQFEKKFTPDMIKAFSKGAFSIILAMFGLEAWSLIYGQIAGEIIYVITLWVVMPWRPSFVFFNSVAKKLLQYGVNIVFVNLFAVLLNNASSLLVGRFMGAATLGLYTLAFRIPEILILQFCSIVSKVVFPYYAKLQDDLDSLKRGYIASTQYIMLITLPIGVGIALVAYPLVEVVFGDKWIEAAPIMQAVSFIMVMSALPYNAGDVFKSRGRPEILTWLVIFNTLILIPSLYLVLINFNSIVIVGWTHAGVAFIYAIVTILIVCRVLDLAYREILLAIIPSIVSSTLMGLTVYPLLHILNNQPIFSRLILSIIFGVIVYFGSLWLFHRKLFLDSVQILRIVMVDKNARLASH